MNAIATPEALVLGAAIGGGFFTGQFFIGAQPYGLITAPKVEGEIAAIQFLKKRKLVAGADSFCDGRANTLALAAAGSPLGEWATSLRIGGYDDWHIGGRLQKLMQFYNLRGVEAFSEGGPEAFERDWYWSSTLLDASNAWCQIFGYGGQYYYGHYGKFWARAVRVIPLQ